MISSWFTGKRKLKYREIISQITVFIAGVANIWRNIVFTGVLCGFFKAASNEL